LSTTNKVYDDDDGMVGKARNNRGGEGKGREMNKRKGGSFPMLGISSQNSPPPFTFAGSYSESWGNQPVDSAAESFSHVPRLSCVLASTSLSVDCGSRRRR